MTPPAVLWKINSTYMAGRKRCYKELLKTDPTAGPRVELQFTVGGLALCAAWSAVQTWVAWRRSRAAA